MLAALFLGGLLSLLLPQGSVDRALFEVNAIAWFGLMAASLLAAGEPAGAKQVFRAALLVLALLLGWILLQVVPIPGNPFEGPQRLAAEDLLGPQPGIISVLPGAATGAALAFALPFAVFLTGLALFDEDARATMLLKWLGRGGGLVALASLAAFEWAPGMTPGSGEVLTGPLVNRNSAATLFGIVALLLVALAAEAAAAFSWRGLLAWFLDPRRHRRPAIPAGLVLDAPLALLTLAAVFLTGSRGGTAATLIGLSVLVAGIAVAPPRSSHRRASAAPSGRRWVLRGGAALLGLGAVAVIGLAFAGRVIRRADLQGPDDERFCILPQLWTAAMDAWPAGTGAGSFRVAFAGYRDPACGISGVWYRAHNDWLEGLITLGAPFALMAAAGLGFLLTVLVRGLRDRRSRRAMPLAGLAILALVSTHALVDFSLQIPAVAAVFSAVLAGTVTIAVGRRAEAASGGRIRPAPPGL